jgi:Do/DeqQ family serine protease
MLVLAAIAGSLITLGAYRFVAAEGHESGISYQGKVPTAAVTYTVNEKGEMVPLNFTGTAEKVTPAVVHIRSTISQSQRQEQTEYFNPFREFFPEMPDQAQPAQSTGSGVIITENGYIVTNNHVVQQADIVEVTLADNRSFKAEVIGTDPDTDLAVIKVEQKGLPYLSFVDSDKSRVGEWVLAVGNPFNLNSTVTAGIISAKGRNINIINRNTEQGNTAIESFIQTDAAINPGNSGGALVDMNGGLLGINTAIASTTGAYAGYGFAVPSNLVSKVVDDLLKFGTVQRGWLGVSIQSVNNDLVKEKSLQVSEGAYVAGFAENSAAKEAGLREGDVVVQIDETKIRTNTALIEYIGLHRPGDKVNVIVNRSGKEVTIPVTLKNKEGKVGVVKKEELKGLAALSVQVEDVDPAVLRKLDLKNGVRVKSIGNGKIGRYTDIREGFIITKVNEIDIKTAAQLDEILKNKKPGEIVTLEGTYEDFPREYLYSFRM